MYDQNTVELVLETLKFYANEKNYETINGTVPVMFDMGHIARHILETVKKNGDQLTELNRQLDELVDGTTEKQMLSEFIEQLKHYNKQ